MGNNSSNVKLSWRMTRKSLCRMTRETDAVVGPRGSMVYFKPAGTKYIYVFDTLIDAWSRFPNSITTETTIALIDGLLTTIGGYTEDGQQTDKLFSLIGEGFDKRWKEMFPPMPTKRTRTAVLNTGVAVIVAGGMEDGPNRTRTLKTVEVLNIHNRNWFTATSLPEPCFYASAQLCGESVYVLRGNQSCVSSTSVMKCSLPALLQSCHSKNTEGRATQTLQDPVWNTVAELPMKSSAFVSVKNHLLAIGGTDNQENDKYSTAVYMYSPSKDLWRIVSHLDIPRRDCFAVNLWNEELMVVGGVTDESFGDASNAVEISNTC